MKDLKVVKIQRKLPRKKRRRSDGDGAGMEVGKRFLADAEEKKREGARRRQSERRLRQEKGYLQIDRIVIRDREAFLEILKSETGFEPKGHERDIKEKLVRATEHLIEKLCKQHRWRTATQVLVDLESPMPKLPGHRDQEVPKDFEERIRAELMEEEDDDEPAEPIAQGQRKPPMG